MGFKYWPVLFLISVYAPSALAQKISVQLTAIEKVRPQERGGDELYFNITEFPSKSTPHYYQVPNFPSHWLSEHLNKVQNIVLWEKDIECEEHEVIFSLIEQDAAPWNIDDLLGSVKLKIACQGNQLITQWVSESHTTQLPAHKEGFTFKGAQAEYRAVFKIKSSGASR